MPQVNLDPAQSVLLVIDVQSALMPHIHDADRVVNRIGFLAEIAKLLEIPILATEQNPSKMGATDDRLTPLLSAPLAKMSFDAGGDSVFMAALRATKRTQCVLTGVETHICVGLTAQTLLREGFEVVVCPDAVSSRTMERHKLGMERIRDAGAVPAHTESVAYEWLQTAENPKFRQALGIVKAHP